MYGRNYSGFSDVIQILILGIYNFLFLAMTHGYKQKFLFKAMTHGYDKKIPVYDKKLAENHQIFGENLKYLMIFSNVFVMNRNFLFVALSHDYKQEFLVHSHESSQHLYTTFTVQHSTSTVH